MASARRPRRRSSIEKLFDKIGGKGKKGRRGSNPTIPSSTTTLGSKEAEGEKGSGGGAKRSFNAAQGTEDFVNPLQRAAASRKVASDRGVQHPQQPLRTSSLGGKLAPRSTPSFGDYEVVVDEGSGRLGALFGISDATCGELRVQDMAPDGLLAQSGLASKGDRLVGLAGVELTRFTRFTLPTHSFVDMLRMRQLFDDVGREYSEEEIRAVLDRVGISDDMELTPAEALGMLVELELNRVVGQIREETRPFSLVFERA